MVTEDEFRKSGRCEKCQLKDSDTHMIKEQCEDICEQVILEIAGAMIAEHIISS
jgi:hypothetical protein